MDEPASFFVFDEIDWAGNFIPAVDRVYALLSLKNEEPGEYESQIRLGERYTATWDEPSMPEGRNA